MLVTPRAGAHAEFHSRTPLQPGSVELTRLDEPILTRVQMLQRAFECGLGTSDDRSDGSGELPTRPHAKAPHGVAQLTQEGGIVVDVAHHDGQTGRAALLTGVPEGRLHEVLHRDVDIGARADQYGVLAAGLGEKRDVRSPGREHEGGLERARQDHGVHVAVGDEMTTAVVVSGRHELQDVARNTPGPQLLHQLPRRGHGLGGRFQDDGVTGRERGTDAPGRNRVGKVPRRHHDDRAERGGVGEV